MTSEWEDHGPRWVVHMATIKKHGAHWYVKCDQCAQWTCVLDTGMSLPAIEAAAGYLCPQCCDPEGAAAKWEALQAQELARERAQRLADRALERELSLAASEHNAREASSKRRRLMSYRGDRALGRTEEAEWRPPSPQTIKARVSSCPACKGKVSWPIITRPRPPLTLVLRAPGSIARTRAGTAGGAAKVTCRKGQRGKKRGAP